MKKPSGKPGSTSLLHRLARLHGIEVQYRDGIGATRIVPDHALRKILGSMKVPAATPDEILESIRVERSVTHEVLSTHVSRPLQADTPCYKQILNIE